MSWLPTSKNIEENNPKIDSIILPRISDIGNFEVKRALPSKQRQMVGPFIFWDQMGPGEFISGQGLDVRPHPHIGLSTITYLFEGTMDHKDSLGNDIRIKPGEINLMTAGNGIVHSERTGQDIRQSQSDLFGIQSWIAQPKKYEDLSPKFQNFSSKEIKIIDANDIQGKVLFGEIDGLQSSIKSEWDTLYLDLELSEGSKFELKPLYHDRALYIISGNISIMGEQCPNQTLIVLKPDEDVIIEANNTSRVLVLGGEPMDGPRYIYWNFVSSSKEKIEEAKSKWKNWEFPKIQDDNLEFIPLP